MLFKRKLYKVVDEDTIHLLRGPYAGIVYKYGGVRLEPDSVNDKLIIHFTYEIVSGHPRNATKFHRYIGDLLTQLIDDRLKNGNMIFRSVRDDADEDDGIIDEEVEEDEEI